MKDTLKAYCVFITALLLACSLSADTLRLKHRNSATNPDEAQALLATHLQAFAGPSFNEYSLKNLLKQGLSPAEAAASLKSVTMLYEPLNGDILLSGANEKALNAVADAIIETGLGIYFDAVQAHILATKAKGGHALVEPMKNERYSGPAEIHWQVDRSAEATNEPQANAHATTQAANAQASAQTASTHTPAQPTGTEPSATAAQILLLKHYSAPDQAEIPHIVETTLARQLAAFSSEFFRRDGLEALAKSGLSPADAAKTFDALTLRYNFKTHDLSLSGADEPALSAIAEDAVMPLSVREGIDVYMQIAEDARQRGDTAFLEKYGFGTRTGGHASLWRIVGIAKKPALRTLSTPLIRSPLGQFALSKQMPLPPFTLPEMKVYWAGQSSRTTSPEWWDAYRALRLETESPLPYAKWVANFSPQYQQAYQINEAMYDRAQAMQANSASAPPKPPQAVLYSVQIRDAQGREHAYAKVINLTETNTAFPSEATAYQQFIDTYEGWVQTYFFEKQNNRWVNQIPHEAPIAYALSAESPSALDAIIVSGKFEPKGELTPPPLPQRHAQ